ncbi:MAG TPA: peptide MFS transporter [Hyphomonadaceae bacterium]|mgnify:CR=1 FL=1|nr:peptide MFS transporter [Hyphomonadaceae bacterium]HPN05397.1 peptide MFS transporter [Hyphomonadaceae bacterium]
MEFFNIIVVVGLLITGLTAIPVFAQMRNHPRGLHILFFAEMWERFSYYGMRSILIFYLTQHFLFSGAFAGSQYGAYTSLVYLLPLIGGILADRYLGTKKSVAFGALLLVAGHVLMAAEGEPAVQTMKVGASEYRFEVEGRAGDRRIFLPVADARCELNPKASAGATCSITPNAAGDLVFTGLPANSPLPATIAKADYTFDVADRNPLFVGIFYMALSLIIVGVGFLKSNISSMVGQLYPQGDPRRDPGYTLYYYGINLGSFWASALCGLLGQSVGWWAGFGLAGIGMLFGWIVFTRQRLFFWSSGPKQLPPEIGNPPEPEKLAAKVAFGLSREQIIYVCGILSVGVVWLLVQSPPASILESLNAFADKNLSMLGITSQPHIHIAIALLISSALILGYIFWNMRGLTSHESQRIGLALVLVAAATVFWTLFEQAGSSLNLFAERNTQLPNDGFFTINAAQTQSFNSAFILIFAPVFAALWTWLGVRKMDPNPTLKFGLGIMQVGFGFFMLTWGATFADGAFQVPIIFLILLNLFHTTGELFVSPVGLSAVSKLSVFKLLSTMMATWFLANAWAGYASGIIAGMADTETIAGAALDNKAALDSSLKVFEMLGWWGLGIGAALCVASFFLKHLAHGAFEEKPEVIVDPAEQK